MPTPDYRRPDPFEEEIRTTLALVRRNLPWLAIFCLAGVNVVVTESITWPAVAMFGIATLPLILPAIAKLIVSKEGIEIHTNSGTVESRERPDVEANGFEALSEEARQIIWTLDHFTRKNANPHWGFLVKGTYERQFLKGAGELIGVELAAFGANGFLGLTGKG